MGDFWKNVLTLGAHSRIEKEKDFYKYLEMNKKEFNAVFVNEGEERKSPGGNSQESKLIRIIKAISKSKEFTDDDEDYLQDILILLKEGGVAKMTIKKIVQKIEKEDNPLKILTSIRSNISPALFIGTLTKSAADISYLPNILIKLFLSVQKCLLRFWSKFQ